MNLRGQAPAKIKRGGIDNGRADWRGWRARATCISPGFGRSAEKVIAASHDGADVSS